MRRNEPTPQLLKALAVTAELTVTDLSKPAAAVMASDLAGYPEDQVLGALDRCRKELRPRCLTVAAILERLDDGRPGPEEAWSMIPVNEEPSVVWTDEMRSAMGVAWPLIRSGDLIPARMAFLEQYRKLVSKARADRTPVKWSFSPGTSKDGRELALLDALEKGRISEAYCKICLPHHREDEGLNARLLSIVARTTKQLTGPSAS